MNDLLLSLAAGERAPIPTALEGQKLPYMPLYVSNVMGSPDVAGMTEVQFSRYMHLLLRAWDSETPGFLPADPELIWRAAGAPSRRAFEANSGWVSRKFEKTTDGLYLFNRRLLKEYALRSLEREAKVRGGRTRAGQLKESSRTPSSASVSNQNYNQNHNQDTASRPQHGRNPSQGNLPQNWNTTLDNGLTVNEAAWAISKEHPWLVAPEKAQLECAWAIERVASQRSISLSAAAEHVKDMTLAYAQSPRGRRRDKYAKTAPVWFRDGHYDDDPAAWEEREPETASRGESAPLPTGFIPASEKMRQYKRARTDELEPIGGLA